MSEQPLSDFDPFAGDLTLEQARARVAEACAGADDGEIFFERRAGETLTLDDERLKGANVDASEGFGLRVVRGEAVGYAHSPRLTPDAVATAADTARLAAASGGGALAAPPPKTNQRLYGDEDPISEIAFAAKVAALRAVDVYARALDPRVRQVSVSAAANRQEIVILRPDGDIRRDVRPMTRVRVSVIVEENGRRESGSAGGGGRRGYGDALDAASLRAMADEALRQALVNLEAQEAPAGPMEVALGPGWCGVLLHEAVGHGLEGDFNRKKTSAFAGLVGEMVAAEGVTVVDDGAVPGARGSVSIDDEGGPGRRNVLIENGRLVGYMQDRQNARLMGVEATGNGRRQSYAHAPMPRMTNTFMEGGSATPEEVVAAVKDGIYATQFGGGQVDITSGQFVFDCTEAYRVKNGKILHPVRGATLIGDGPSAMRRVSMVGSDMALDPGIGMCGKAGQWVPVTVGQPTLLIEGVTVGGKG